MLVPPGRGRDAGYRMRFRSQDHLRTSGICLNQLLGAIVRVAVTMRSTMRSAGSDGSPLRENGIRKGTLNSTDVFNQEA